MAHGRGPWSLVAQRRLGESAACPLEQWADGTGHVLLVLDLPPGSGLRS
jgi:hypothetical protein